MFIEITFPFFFFVQIPTERVSWRRSSDSSRALGAIYHSPPLGTARNFLWTCSPAPPPWYTIVESLNAKYRLPNIHTYIRSKTFVPFVSLEKSGSRMPLRWNTCVPFCRATLFHFPSLAYRLEICVKRYYPYVRFVWYNRSGKSVRNRERKNWLTYSRYLKLPVYLARTFCPRCSVSWILDEVVVLVQKWKLIANRKVHMKDTKTPEGHFTISVRNPESSFWVNTIRS